jgi:hypothetical protein
MTLQVQAADMKKPHTAVKRSFEKGNHIVLGPERGDNYIWNKETGNKMRSEPKGKQYAMEVSCVHVEKTGIVVESGAEESASPSVLGERFGTQPGDRWMSSRSAGGDRIEHCGERTVQVVSFL